VAGGRVGRARWVLRRNFAGPAADLIDGLWGADPPTSALNLVQTYVSAWRKAVEPCRTDRGGGDRLLTAAPGYRLRIEPGELDLDQFSAAVADGQAAAEVGDHGAAEGLLGEALALRGGAARSGGERGEPVVRATRLRQEWWGL